MKNPEIDYSDPENVQARLDELEKMRNPGKVEGAVYQPGMSFAAYRTIGENSTMLTVNASTLKHETPLHVKWAEREAKDSEALAMGDALHRAVLEPESFDREFERYYITSATKTWGTQKNAELATLYPDKIILTETMIEKVKWMRDAIHRHHLARRLLAACDERELVGIAPDPTFKVARKIRIDGRPSKDNSEFILDIKTSRTLMESSFGFDCRKYGYHLQGAYYLDTDAMISGRRRQQFIILGVTNTPPYYCRVYTLPPDAIEEGRNLYLHRMAKLVEAAATNRWSAFEDESDPIPIPWRGANP